MESNRGFITVATGDYYCWLAENLVMSYKLFSNTKYPMYVMTDKEGEERLKKHFDGVILLEEPYYSFMDKMIVYQNSPFNETIFLDADMNIIRDISFLFDDFEKNASVVSCIGEYRKISDTVLPIHFGKKSVEKFCLERFIAFGGGIYYYKKCSETDDFFQFIFSDLVLNYKEYQLKEFRNGQMADEPLIGLAMLVKNMMPLDSEKDIMKFHDNMMDTFGWNFKTQTCRFICWGVLVNPSIVHYGTHNTFHKKYVFYNCLVRAKYFKMPIILVPFYIAFNEFRLLYNHVRTKNDRRAFYKWLKSHFTKDHFVLRKKQIQNIFSFKK